MTLYEDYESLYQQDFQTKLIDVVHAFAEKVSAKAVLLQKRFLRGAPIEVLQGELPEKNYAIVDGLKFALNLNDNQNIGFFLDMKPGHHWIK